MTVLAGSFGVHNNSQRLANMPAQYAQNPVEFVQAERGRFDGPNGGNAWWVPLQMLWAALAIVGIANSFSSLHLFVHRMAIRLIVIGAMGFPIDGFAHHRAKLYTAALLAQNVPQKM